MAKIVVIYPVPDDVSSFENNYFEKHVPLVLNIPHLRSFTVSQNVDCSKRDAVHLIAELGFDSMCLLHEALSSPECQASVENLATFVPEGVITLAYDTETLFEARWSPAGLSDPRAEA